MNKYIVLHIYAVEKGRTKLQVVRNTRRVVDHATAKSIALRSAEELLYALGSNNESAYQTKRKGRLLDSLSKYIILRLPDDKRQQFATCYTFGVGSGRRKSTITPIPDMYKGKTIYFLLCPFKSKNDQLTYFLGGIFRNKKGADAVKQPGDKIAFAFTSQIAPEVFIGTEPEEDLD